METLSWDKKDGLSKESMLSMYRRMVEIRFFEERLYDLFRPRGGRVALPGTMHQCNGQEAVAVGACEALAPDDYITSTHRGHGHCIARGVPLRAMMAELFARRTGICHGMGGSMHMADASRGVLGTFSIVGAGIPIAVGAGLSSKFRKSGQVTACFFGDGAANTGAFHEGLNLAAIWDLPVIFVCENNLYAVSTHINTAMRAATIAERSAAYGIPAYTLDGNDVFAVYREVSKAVVRARKGEGPTFLECLTYRHLGHARFDPATYRPKQEKEAWLQRDPILRFEQWAEQQGMLAAGELETVREQTHREIEDAVAYAESSPPADENDPFTYLSYCCSGK